MRPSCQVWWFRTREHKLIDILVIGVCCLICGGEGFTDMETFAKSRRDWLSRFLELPGGIPSHDTFNRVFCAIDPRAFMDCFMRWTQSLRSRVGEEIVALDGKALRRARNEDAGLPYIVSAWASQNGLALGQVKVNDKSNEITAIPELLKALDLAGCIVTIDAMGCQKKIAEKIVDQKKDFSRRHESTGEWKTACIGRWMSLFAKTTRASEPDTPRKISRPCDDWL